MADNVHTADWSVIHSLLSNMHTFTHHDVFFQGSSPTRLMDLPFQPKNTNLVWLENEARRREKEVNFTQHQLLMPTMFQPSVSCAI